MEKIYTHTIFTCVLTTSTWWPVVAAVFSAIAEGDGTEREWCGHPRRQRPRGSKRNILNK